MDEQNIKDLSELNNVNHRKYINFFTDEGSKSSDGYLIEEPRICMHCRNTGKQLFIDLIAITGKKNKFDALGVYGCSFCKESTISFYILEKVSITNTETNSKEYGETLFAVSYLPKDIFHNNISKRLQRNYSDFYEIYSQAEEAEEKNLNHLAGMGYRKAIEFLITDFLKAYPTDETVNKEWLENPQTRLNDKIKKLPNERLRKTANAITYLGNDETHYSIRHPNYNLSDMKRFIALLIKEIESEFIYEDIEDFLG